MHKAEIIECRQNQELSDRRIVVKFIDCSQDRNSFADFEREYQAMLNIEYYKLKGFCRLIDSGSCDEILIQGLLPA